MLEFIDFWDIAHNLNLDNPSFTNREVMENAYDCWLEFLSSKDSGKPTYTIEELLKFLDEYGDDEDYKYWRESIREEIGAR